MIVKIYVSKPEDVAEYIGRNMTAGLVAMQLQTHGHASVNYQGKTFSFWYMAAARKEVESTL